MRTLGILLPVMCMAQVYDLAITNATIVDGTGRTPYVGTVLVKDGRLHMTSGTEFQAAQTLEARGMTVTPGFFDLHTHLPYSSVREVNGDWGKTLKAYLLAGVTTVTDFGSYGEMFEPMRRLLATGIVEGPRLHLAARMTTPYGHGAEGGRGDFHSLEVQTPGEARAAARRLLRYNPDAIKVFTDGWRYGGAPDMTSMDEETLRAIVEEAHARGVEVLTHTVTRERAKIAARAGVDVIAHGIGDQLADVELIQLMKDRDTTYAPTLAVYENKPGGLWSPLLKDFLEPAAVKILARTKGRVTTEPHRLARWKNLMGNVAALREAGIRFGVGTDAGVTGAHHGFSTLREMQLLVGGGLTPLEAITAATGNSARALRVDHERGTLTEGKIADVVVIDGQPHERIDEVTRIRQVVMGGRVLDLARLRSGLAAEGMTPIPARAIAASIDDFEGERTLLDTMRVNATDSGVDHSRMSFGIIYRAEGGKALSIHARMPEKDKPYAQVVLPLTKGAFEPADVSKFIGIRFEARGDGAYRVMLQTRGARGEAHASAEFRAGSKWQTVSIRVDSLQGVVREPTAVVFEIARPRGEFGWLELDNVAFY